MLLKGLGGALLIGLSVAYCASCAARWQTARRKLCAFVTLLSFTRGHISCFGTPLSDILEKAPPGLLEDIVGAPAHCPIDFSSLCLCTEDLPDEARRLLGALSDEIGTIWRQEQLERLGYYIDALEKEKTAFCSALPSRLRLHGTLSLCGALALILLIW